ncbi:MAG: hypothetical protein ACO21S_09095 [Sediminibacterium sp.]
MSYTIAIGIANGSVSDKYFAGPMNEMGCAVIAFSMGTFSLIAFDWKGFFKFLNQNR